MKAYPLPLAAEIEGQFPSSGRFSDNGYRTQAVPQGAWQAWSYGGNETVLTVLPPLPPHYYPLLLQLVVNESSPVFGGDVRNFKLTGQPNNGLCEVGELPTANSPGRSAWRRFPCWVGLLLWGPPYCCPITRLI